MELTFTQEDILEAGVDEIIGAESLMAGLKSGRPLRVKLGIDPTSPNIHLGRSIPVWRLRAFQELGHEIHLIIGDFTGQIGDTSDKDAERPMLEEATIQKNLEKYLEQLWMILNPARKDQVHIHYNSEWLGTLSLGTLGHLADAFSVNTFIKRELIARRLEGGSRVSLREMLYPLMQGYDSVMVKADVELGGTDQRFNLLAGRTLQEQAGQPAQAVITNPLIAGTDGRKMSSSWGNIISLLDTPQDKFGKLMRVADELMGEYLQIIPLSARPFSKEEIEKRVASGENPRDLKLELAQTVVALYHGDDEAAHQREAFISQFSEGNKPEEIPDFSIEQLQGATAIVDLLVTTGLAPSRSEARRLIDGGGVRVNDRTITDTNEEIELTTGLVLQVGKRRFIRLV
ncbi:MAG: tyrosine--tRNA ligase [bacterium]